MVKAKNIGYSRMVSSLPKGLESSILQESMGLKKDESLLIVTDRERFALAMRFFAAGQKIATKTRLVTIDIPKQHGSEPHHDVAKMMRGSDVVLLITTKSLTHTHARKDACKRGARIASMPGLTKEMFSSALKEKMISLQKRNRALLKKLSGKKDIRIVCKRGTNISFQIKGRKWISDNGDFRKRGSSGNLPAGEVFIAPLEGTAQGKIVVDASIAGLGKVDKPVFIEVSKGKLVRIAGSKMAGEFSSWVQNDLYRNVAELGIGTNGKAKICGEVLEDEKVLGTIHIAFGNNKHFGGKVDVPFHIDVVVKNPRIFADGFLVRV